MRTLGFDNYEGVLKVYLAKYREVSSATARLFVHNYANTHSTRSTRRARGKTSLAPTTTPT